MNDHDEQVEYHRQRIDQLITRYWIAAAVAGLVLGVILWLTPLRWFGLPVGIALALATAGWVIKRSETWLVTSCGGRTLQPGEDPRFENVVEGLCATSGVPQPELRVIEGDAINLVALGRHPERAVLVATEGALRAPRIELEALTANEISQIRSWDTALITTAATTLGLAALSRDFGRYRGEGSGLGRRAVAVLLTPFSGLSSSWLQRELEPHRDFRTDVTGVRLTRYPPGMIAALERAERHHAKVATPNALAAMWVIEPRDSSARPALADRISALREL